MATFPVLSSGGVTQYPTPSISAQGVQVVRFLDGSDQRYLSQGRSLRRWQINLTLLNDVEMAKVEAFFTAQQGEYSPFIFPDPISGADVPNCRLAAAALVSEHSGEDVSSTSFWIEEANG